MADDLNALRAALPEGRVVTDPDIVAAGLQGLASHLLPGGLFGLWSNELPDEEFTQRLTTIFAEARAEPVRFHNPLQNREFTQTIYLARPNDGAERG